MTKIEVGQRGDDRQKESTTLIERRLRYNDITRDLPEHGRIPQLRIIRGPLSLRAARPIPKGRAQLSLSQIGYCPIETKHR